MRQDIGIKGGFVTTEEAVNCEPHAAIDDRRWQRVCSRRRICANSEEINEQSETKSI